MRVDWQHRYSRFRVIHLLAIFLSSTVALNIKYAAMIVVCQGQDQPPVKLSVNDPRPVAEAVKQLQEKYGWIISELWIVLTESFPGGFFMIQA